MGDCRLRCWGGNEAQMQLAAAKRSCGQLRHLLALGNAQNLKANSHTNEEEVARWSSVNLLKSQENSL